MVKPIQIWVASAGPNPWKPVIIAEELGVPYELKQMGWTELMGEEFAKINPGGKVPAMYDPNEDLLLWESGAIILYLIDQYDTEKKLTYTTLKEKHLLNQWLMFQMSQQGPMFGQVGWFNVFEKNPDAAKRYTKQCERIFKILDQALNGKTWLVGDKCTYADLSFFMWNVIIPLSMVYPQGETPLTDYPNVLAWHKRMADRDSVKKVLAIRDEMMAKENLGANAMPTDITPEEMAKQINEKAL